MGGGSAGRRDHCRQRTLDDRHDPDDVLAPLAGDREVMDVEDREVDAAGLEQLDRVGRRRRDDDVQVDAGVDVVVARERLVDPGMDRVRCEVEDQRGAARRGPPAELDDRGAARRQEQRRGQRGDQR